MPTGDNLPVLGRIMRALSTGAGPDEVVGEALSAVAEVAAADLVYFAVPEGSRIRFLVREAERTTAVTFPAMEGALTERVLETGEPLSIPDLIASAHPHRRLLGEESAHARAHVGVPAESGGRLVGVLGAQAYRPAAFTGADVDLLAQVGRLVADAVVSSRRTARIQRRLNQLDRAQRERTDFLVGVAHDMRSPLAGIIGFVRILEELDSVASDPMAKEAVEFIGAESQRLADLVAQLVDLGRVELGETGLERETVDLTKLAGEAIESARRRFPTHRFALHAGGGVVVEGDLLRLHRVVANLIENAAIHGPSAGLVTVEVADDDQGAVVAVSDRGPGVPLDDRRRIFERFVRLDGSGPGTGIGLYLVKVIVDAHGGSVAVDDAPGGGARFQVWLPKGSSNGSHPVA